MNHVKGGKMDACIVAKYLLADKCIYVNLSNKETFCDKKQNQPKANTCKDWLSKSKTIDKIMKDLMDD